MKTNYAWYENEAFWKNFEPVLFHKKRIEDATHEVDYIIRLLNLEKNLKILDLACGPGRHALEFARRKHTVTGVDRTLYYLEKARQLAAKENLQIEFLQSDMRNFVRDEAYDLVLNLFSSFGYFEHPADDKKVLQNIHKSLKQGGYVLFDIMGKEILARIFQEKGWQEIDGHLWLEDRQIKDNWGYIENRWILIKNNKRFEHHFRLRLYSADEFTTLLSESGFSKVTVYGSLKGTDYDHKAERLIISARKTPS